MAPLYSRNPARAFRQALADVLMLSWCVLWCLVGLRLRDALTAASGDGAGAFAGVRRVSGRIDEAADRIADVPLVGDDLAQPISELSGALGGLSDAGGSLLGAFDQAGRWLVVAVIVIPIALAVLAWAPPRLRFVRESLRLASVASLAGQESLLALRALVAQPPTRLREVSEDPVAGWRQQDPDTVRRLANLQLRELGLRELGRRDLGLRGVR